MVEKSMLCDMKDCTNQKVILFMGRWICGDCFMKFNKQKEEDFWKENE